jgi:predicted phosphodiesterase
MAEQPYQVEHTGPNVLTVRMDVESQVGWERWFLLSGDRHHDNPHTDWDLELKHLRQCDEREAGVIDIADLHCAMQGKYDKRSDKSCVRPEHQNGRYLDSLVETAADFYGPFAKRFLVIGDGNHEKSIKQRHETDLNERLVTLLNSNHGGNVQHGGYSGWVRFLFRRGNQKLSRRLWYMHGYGGGGPVTQDTIQAQRQRAYVENADIMVTGHTHDCWAQENIRVRLNNSGIVEQRPVWNVKVPTYKDEYGDGKGGWHVETGKPPKPLGAWWLRFFWEGDRISTEFVRAA